MEENNDINSVGDNITPKKVLRFQDLRRATVGETYQYWNKLVGTKTIHEFENLHELVSSVTPLPLFEETLRVMLIDSLKLENEILEILLSQNDYQIQRILGCKWFFVNLSSELCIKQLFPQISLSLRCKVINRLSKYLANVQEAEKYFIYIKNNYSHERAEYLLPRCSSEVILNYFNEVKPTFQHNCGVRILLNICKRYPEVGIYILSSIFEMKKNCVHELHCYKTILRYLAGYYPGLVVPFLEKYHLYLPSQTLGKKLTKKLGPKLKEQLFPDLMKNLIFQKKSFFLILTFEEQVKFIANVVTSSTSQNLSFYNWKTSVYEVVNLLKWIPPEDRLKMIEAVFKEVYNLNYKDYPKYWYSEMLELIPTEWRQPYVTKLERILKTEKCDLNENEDGINFSADDPEGLIYLFDSSTAFEKFEEILWKSPTVSRRATILPFLVKNCSINNDVQILEKVVDFISTRHRKDDSRVIFNFVEALNEHFSAEQLNSTIFEKLEDLIYFTCLKHHSNHINVFCYTSLREKHIYYNLENNVNVEIQVQSVFETKVSRKGYLGSFVYDIRSKHSKTYILAIFEKIVSWIRNKSTEKDCSTANGLLMSLLDTCSQFNHANKHNQIILRDISGLDEILKNKLKENFSDLGVEDLSLDIWQKFYSNVTNSYYKQDCLSYILKRNPNIVENHLEGFLKILFTNYFKRYSQFFNSFLMTASFFGKLEKVKEIILSEFKKGDTTLKRKNALLLYSHVCTVEEFSEAIEEYLPQQERVERKSVAGFDEIQILIPSLIKNIRPRWKNLQLILKFFFGDFLKAVLPSFWACCSSTRCDIALPFLKKQLDAVPQKISYKKDIIRLINELSDREGKFNFCLKCWSEYKHYSVRSILLLHVSKLFLGLPSKESFQLLEKCILDCDPLTIDAKPDLRKIPKEFWNDYVLALWTFSENQKNPFKNNFRSRILSCFDQDNIKLVSPEFSESIIKENLFNPSSELKVEEFTILYLIADAEAVDSRIQMVLNLRVRKPNSKCFHHFVHLLINESQKNPTNFSEIFSIILKNWPDYPNGVHFEERLLLNYHNLYQKTLKKFADSNTTVLEFGRELRKLHSSVENLNDLIVIYVEALKKFFNSFETSNAIFAIKEMVTGSPNRTLAILAISSLPAEAIAWHKKDNKIFEKNIVESIKVLNELIKTFESYDDRIVEIYLRSKFDFEDFIYQ